MPAEDADRPGSTTALREVRLDRGLSQKDLAELTGIPLRSLERLDRGEVDDISFRWLVNLALALRCSPADLIEREWTEWKPDIARGRPTERPTESILRSSRQGYQRARRRGPRS